MNQAEGEMKRGSGAAHLLLFGRVGVMLMRVEPRFELAGDIFRQVGAAVGSASAPIQTLKAGNPQGLGQGKPFLLLLLLVLLLVLCLVLVLFGVGSC
jgi:hypothetical protein